MPSRELHSNIDVIETFTTAVVTADQNGAGVDSRGFESVEHLIVMGNSGDSLSPSVKIELEIEDSPDNSIWTDVANESAVLTDADTNVTFVKDAVGLFAVVDAPTEDSRVFRIGYRGPQRFSRVVINVTGTHTVGTPIGMCAIRGNASRLPNSGAGV